MCREMLFHRHDPRLFLCITVCLGMTRFQHRRMSSQRRMLCIHETDWTGTCNTLHRGDECSVVVAMLVDGTDVLDVSIPSMRTREDMYSVSCNRTTRSLTYMCIIAHHASHARIQSPYVSPCCQLREMHWKLIFLIVFHRWQPDHETPYTDIDD